MCITDLLGTSIGLISHIVGTQNASFYNIYLPLQHEALDRGWSKSSGNECNIPNRDGNVTVEDVMIDLMFLRHTFEPDTDPQEGEAELLVQGCRQVDASEHSVSFVQH